MAKVIGAGRLALMALTAVIATLVAGSSSGRGVGPPAST